MADMFQQLKTPNGHSYRQPLGLFINNEFVAASGGRTIESVDPAYVSSSNPGGRSDLIGA